MGKAYKSDYPVRLVSFQFNTEQTYVLEFGHLYIRVIKDGGYVLETGKNITAVTQANPGVVTSNSPRLRQWRLGVYLRRRRDDATKR